MKLWVPVLACLLSLNACASTVRCDAGRGLQACIDEATRSGSIAGTVIFPAKTRHELATAVVLYPQTTLRCETGAVIAQAPSAHPESLLRNRGGGNETGITIEGCTFQGTGDPRHLTAGLKLTASGGKIGGLRVAHSTFRDLSDMAIIGSGWENAEIDHNTFRNTGRHGQNTAALYLFAQNGASRGIRVHDNTCDNTAIHTGCFKFAASAGSSLRDIVITKNTVRPGDVGIKDQGTLGIELFAGDNDQNAISDFEIADNDVRGVGLRSRNTWCISVGGAIRGKVLRNRVSDCAAFGIEVVGSEVEVRDNVLTGAGPITVDANYGSRHDVTIAHNTITRATGRGIFYYAANQHCIVNTVVTDNVIQTPNGPALRVQNSNEGGGCPGDEVAISGLKVSSNRMETTTAGSAAVEFLGSTREAALENNRITSSKAGDMAFITVLGAPDITLRNNEFAGPRALVARDKARITDAGGNTRNGAAVSLVTQR